MIFNLFLSKSLHTSISNGKFSDYLTSSFGNSGAVYLEHLKDGTFRARLVSEKWRKITWKAEMKPQGDGWFGKTRPGSQCPMEFTLTRR